MIAKIYLFLRRTSGDVRLVDDDFDSTGSRRFKRGGIFSREK